jgi:glycosyltransferase involved in cell wall biosynthesis
MVFAYSGNDWATPMKNHYRRHCMIVFAPYPLGETRVQREAEALVKCGYEVDVICLRLPGEPARDEYKGVTIYREQHRLPFSLAKGNSLRERLVKYLRFALSAGWRVTRLHFQKRYSTIQVHNIPDFLVFCALIPKLADTPILLDLHDLMPEFYALRFGQSSSRAARLIRWQERLACRFADHVITVTELWRQALIRRGVPEHKCSVVMNVADESIFHPPDHTGVQPPTGDSFRLIYHGTFVERNGLDLAIQAVDRVRHDIPGIHLTLVGRGEYLPHMTRLIEELGLNHHVSIDDLHLAEELPGIILSCQLGIVPIRSTVFTDTGLPTKLMEYAALGLPAIAARTTANQLYFEGTNTEFFEPGNVDDLARCIGMLYHNPERLAELARGAQEFNRRYNWAKIGAEYVATVERLRSNRLANVI